MSPVVRRSDPPTVKMVAAFQMLALHRTMAGASDALGITQRGVYHRLHGFLRHARYVVPADPPPAASDVLAVAKAIFGAVDYAALVDAVRLAALTPDPER